MELCLKTERSANISDQHSRDRGAGQNYVVTTMKTVKKTLNRFVDNLSDYAGGAFLDSSPLNYKEILAVRMDLIGNDFPPLDATVSYSRGTIALPLHTGEMMEVSLSDGVRWDTTFATQPHSSVLYLFSLAPIGRLLSSFQRRHDAGALQFAVVALKSFLDYSSKSGRQSSIGRISSADHSAAVRVRVLIKFIQVMRERQDVDYALLIRVCDCLKYWSDWLSKSKHYSKNNHGLMGAIALLHSAIQFGSTPHSSAYLEVSTSRIMELVKSSFDRDGLCNENTIGYHAYNLSLYQGLVKFCKHYRLSETLVSALEEVILRATSALEFCVWQDGSIPPLGDSPVYRTKLISRNKSRCFYESGFAVVKNDDLYLSILCGASTETHKQVDDSSITLRFMNRDIFIDGGSYLYDTADPYRQCIASSLGHSGVFLKEFDGLVRSDFRRQYGPVSGKIERFEESDEGVRVTCRYSIRDGRAVFVRNIFVCWPDEVAIVDSVEVDDHALSPETVQRFLFGPTLDVRVDGRGKLILASEDFSCSLFQLSDCDSVLYRGESGNPYRGWYSYKFKEILPTYAVDFVLKSQMSRFSTIIKLAKCTNLSECSTTVRAFAGLVDLNGKDRHGVHSPKT